MLLSQGIPSNAAPWAPVVPPAKLYFLRFATLHNLWSYQNPFESLKICDFKELYLDINSDC